MNYTETIDYLLSQLPVFHRIGKAAYKANLDNTYALSQHLGNPEKKFRSIHIAGTNGKGSVSNILASVLHEAGYKTGLTTSPHLRDFRERFRINGKMIPKRYVIDFVSKQKSFFEYLKPSFFEMSIALAFDYFANENVDIAIIEAGMGGRLDSTNIIKPELSIITNIAKDHTAFLGDTIEKIAVEKAGIIKNGIPVIIGRKQNETFSVFEEKSNETKSKLFYADNVCSIVDSNTIYRNNRYWLDLTVEKNGKIKNYLCDQFGPYQNENIITALTAIEVFNNQGNYLVSEDNIKNGLKNVRKNTGFEGRWQINGRNPKTLFDTGHNIDGLSVTMSHLKNFKYRKLHFVLGMVDDKDVSSTLKILPQDAIYYFCKPDIPRGLDVDLLSDAAKKATLTGKSYSSVRAAYESAMKNANQDDLIFVGGSTFVVAEVI